MVKEMKLRATFTILTALFTSPSFAGNPDSLPSLREISRTTDDKYRYEIVEATCSDMARFLASSPEPGNPGRPAFVAWLAQQPGNFVFVTRLSNGKETGERGCFVRTDYGYRITVHGRAQSVEYYRSH